MGSGLKFSTTTPLPTQSPHSEMATTPLSHRSLNVTTGSVDAIVNVTQSIISHADPSTNLSAKVTPNKDGYHDYVTPSPYTILSTTPSMYHNESTIHDSHSGFDDVKHGNGSSRDYEHMTFLGHSFLFQTVLLAAMMLSLFAIIYYLRRRQLDRLRHHLMPVYNFDPSDDGEDWEAELLDDQMVHRPTIDPNPNLSGQLKLDTGLTRGLRVHNNNSSSILTGHEMSESKHESGSTTSPTAASGLLSSSSDSYGQNPRRMYTNERDPIA